MAKYTVGVKTGAGSTALTVEGEDALMAALRVKIDQPSAMITYVRRANRRGDRRHPHEDLTIQDKPGRN